MKYLAQEKSIKFEKGPITAYEYPLGDKDLNCAVVEIRGRYPEEGWTQNTECKELTYLIRGFAVLTTETDRVSLSEGDMVIVDINEKYFWEGDCTLLVPCTPAWSPEQTKNTK
jgi:mannose-6-phosphate isomerase-like protein (cupin superfamily)